MSLRRAAGAFNPVFPGDAGRCRISWRSDNRFRLLIDGPQFFPAMIEAIERAERRIDLELYLVEDGHCPERMLEPLVRAAERGVRVRCLFDGFGCLKMSQANRDRMTAAGIELRLYNPLSLRLKLRNLHRDHRKLLLVDGGVGFVGGTGITDEFWNPRKPAVHWHEVMVEMFGHCCRTGRSCSTASGCTA